MAHNLGARDLGDWWNPYPPEVWFFAFVVGLVALLIVGGAGASTWTIVFGCLAAQAHVSFLFLVVVASLAAALAARLTREVRAPRRSAWRAGAVIVAGFWALVLWDLAFASRNLNRIKRYLTQSHKVLGVVKGMQLAARELMPWGPFAQGSQPHNVSGVAGASLLWLAVLVVAIVPLVYLARRDRVMLAFAVPAFAIALTGAYAAKGLDGFVWDYLVTFLLATAAAFWWLVGAAAIRSVTRTAVVVSIAVVTVLTTLTATVATASHEAVLPGQEWAPIVNVASQRLTQYVGTTDRPLVLDYLDDGSGLIAPGVIGVMAARYDVRTIDSARFFKWGHKRAYLPPAPFAAYTIIPVYPDGRVSAPNACILARHPRIVVNTTALSPQDARDFKSLQLLNYVHHGHLTGGVNARFAALSLRSARVIVVAGLFRATC
jgi:hypothetical protein